MAPARTASSVTAPPPPPLLSLAARTPPPLLSPARRCPGPFAAPLATAATRPRGVGGMVVYPPRIPARQVAVVSLASRQIARISSHSPPPAPVHGAGAPAA
ncbi:hypothetical protein PVAP13_6KG148806 [Panicum virgatum]|uniref:Uncharacterized protein n=1 Tax=Panicum virgatum TaxID=38727 RepID=A0A8T0RCA9_PANVG|nr:hypothetical protein PVAP13_6KG148806 [Panicum virgatum]